MARLPTLFIGHGAPPLLDDPVWMTELRDWARALPVPRAILIVSAHWETQAPTVGATTPTPLVYDFYGFPQRFFQMQYPSPGAPWLAERLAELVPGLQQQAGRGLDHGAWVPLMAMYPDADVPVLQLSLPGRNPTTLRLLGEALRPLRDEGVLIVGSGFLTHNLRHANFRGGPPAEYAVAFDAWVRDVLDAGDLDRLARFETEAPNARLAHPRDEHFVPLFVAAEAGRGDPVTYPIEGWVWGPFTKRSVQFGASS